MRKIVNGFIIEADKSGYFYHRTRSWIEYDIPEKAYVWTEDEVKKILEAAKTDPRSWELKPSVLHPSTYYSPIEGKVEINSLAIKAGEFGSPALYKGAMITEAAKKFTVSSHIVAVAVHL